VSKNKYFAGFAFGKCVLIGIRLTMVLEFFFSTQPITCGQITNPCRICAVEQSIGKFT
jgi:hypothetical protein